ncbi:MAG: hypothetical protein HY614_08845 [Candidatus Rokubacteria bacterium]|nr:hypothetical protein [Candidatus Rokubacteria bacterium]
MKIRYFYPLLGFVVPTIAIGYGIMIPRSCMAGLNDLTIGFASSILGAVVTYWAGVRTVYRDFVPPERGERRLPVRSGRDSSGPN